MNRLIYEHEGKQHEVRLSNRPVSFGRGDEADHKLPTKMASRIHVQVFPRERGWWVEDLASSNGTLLNGNRLAKPTPLSPGDVIAVGDIKLKFEGAPPTPKGPPDHLLGRLVYQPGQNKPPVEVLIRDRVTIGRKPDNTLQIDEKAISGTHCEIINRDGVYLFRDLGSSNGSFVSSKRVTEHTLRNGDVLLLGKKISVYFIDPAAKPDPAPEPPAPAAAPAPATKPSASGRMPAKPSSAANASDRGSFEAVAAAGTTQKVAINPLPHIAIGAGLGLLFLLCGWLIGSLIGGMRNRPVVDPNAREPMAALADAAMSFEGNIDERGNPDGWSATFEALGGSTAELVSDRENPFDGAGSLSVRASDLKGSGTLVLQTTQPRKLDLGAAFQLSIAMKGEGASKIALAVSMIDDKGGVTTLAAGSFVGIKSTDWSVFTLTATVLSEVPESANLRLLVAGAYTRLWIDRLELTKTADSRVTQPFEQVDAPGLKLALDPAQPVQLVVSNPNARAVRFLPRLLNADHTHASEDSLWAVSRVESDNVTYNALLASRGDAAAVRVRADSQDNGYFPERGARLIYELTQHGGTSLAVDVVIPLPANATLAVADRRGYPMLLDKAAVHAYEYATISEVMVNETGVSVSFPRGAVVWFDLSRRGEVVVTVRAAQEGARRTMTIDVNARPLMFARLYGRLYDEAEGMRAASHHAAAEERFRYLTRPSLPDGDLPVVAKAHERLKDIAAHRADLATRMDAAWQVGSSTRTRPALTAARQLILQYVAEFPADDVIRELRVRLDSIDGWLAGMDAKTRTPEELAKAEAAARQLYQAADQSFKDGNLLLAMVMIETLQRDFPDTSHYNSAEALRLEIAKLLEDPVEQNKVIDAELKAIDEDIKFEDFNRARQRCLSLFKRFPDSARNREIMQRLRQIESQFQD